ncbi:MAG TPA: beta-L-arabinofuranosidase domain-containing protein [Steroidobacteraceae bacterium]|nr:beta-L-arabinofuranosidase domain-containing protein [Steroidobacteraceae bacterium]
MSDQHSRRDALRFLGAGVAATSASGAVAQVLFRDDEPPVEYFRLANVRLGPGPFLEAQKLDADYLLRLEPDRLLHNFRKNAGLEPPAPVYGGWESVEPWIDIRCHGHTLGHYLTAAACMYESTDDSRFAERVDYIVAQLAECQQKTGGWLTAFPDGIAPLTDSLAGRPFAGVPWYTTHKVLAGLRDAYLHRGSDAALAVLIRFADWIILASRETPEARFQKMLDREHGGMNEVCADLFAITKNTQYAALALRFSHRTMLDSLAASRDTLDGLHANTQIPKVIGFSRISQLSLASDHGRAAEFFWRTVTDTRSFATGGHGDVEHFFPPADFARHLGSAKTMETCCTHNMLRLTRSLYTNHARVRYMDYFERALFNGILASQDPATGMMTYFQSTRPGYLRLYHTPFDSFWCCTGSGLENHARYGESVYARDGQVLYLNLFLASTLDWRERQLQVVQETRFPDEDTTRLRFHTTRAQELELAIRHPAWCAVMTLTFNGRRKVVSRRPGEYLEFKRRIRNGDTLELHLPMEVHLEPLPNAPDYAAVMYGPIVLAARLGTQGITPGSQLIVNERKSGEMLNEAVEIPGWSKPLEELPASLLRTSDDSVTFASAGFVGGRRVEFIPWFRMAHERYNLYWRRSG